MQSMILICCRYQVLLGVLFALLELPHAWCMLLHKFLAPEVDHWCRKPEELEHWTDLQWRNFSSPPGDSCHIYKRSQGRNAYIATNKTHSAPKF